MNQRIDGRIKVSLIVAAVFVLFFSLTTEGKLFWKGVSKLLTVQNRDAVADDFAFNIHFIDVGKADAILIENEGTFICVDGGDVGSGKEILSYLKRRGVQELEAIFISHPDADHIGSFPEIMRAYPVKSCYSNGEIAETDEYLTVDNIIKRNHIPLTTLSAGDTFQIGDIGVSVLSPGSTFADTNDLSLVLKLTYHEFTVLLTGDAGEAAENTMLEETPKELQSDILKISHHGSKTASTEGFLRAVNPAAAVISTGADKNNLPAPEVTERLSALQIPSFRTDEEGTVIVSTNGEGIINFSTKERNYEIVNR